MNPNGRSSIDPKITPEKKDDDTTYWETQVKKTRLQREFKTEKKLMEEVENPPLPPEPAFKVTGGVNLGTIDLQEQQRQAREETLRLQREANERIERAEKSATDAREALNRANLEHMQSNLGAQIAQLQTAINSGNKRDIFSELENVENIASKLGYAKGSPGVSESRHVPRPIQNSNGWNKNLRGKTASSPWK